MNYTHREIELMQIWAKIKQIEDIIIVLISDKNKLKSQAAKAQRLANQETLE